MFSSNAPLIRVNLSFVSFIFKSILLLLYPVGIFHYGILALLRFLVYCILYTNKTKHLCDAIEFQGHFEFSGNNFFKFKKEKITWLVQQLYIYHVVVCVCVCQCTQYGVCGLDDKVTHFMVSVQWGGSLLSNKSLHSQMCKLSFGRYIF